MRKTITRSAENAMNVIHFPSRDTATPRSADKAPAQILLGEVIKAYRKKRKMSQQELADIMGVTRNTIVNWEANKSRPEFDGIPQLCSVLDVSMETLFGLDHAPGITKEEQTLVSAYRQLSAVGKKVASAMLNAMLDEECKAMDASFRSTYSILSQDPGAAAAGPGFEYTDEKPTPVFIRRNDISMQADAIVRVSGTSMEPVYHEGNYVYIRYADSAYSGEDVVCATANGLVIKRMSENGQLYSVNKAQPFGKKYEDDHIVIRGRVLGIVSPADYAPDADLPILNELFHDELKEFYETHRIDETE